MAVNFEPTMPDFEGWDQPEDFDLFCVEDPRGLDKGCPEEVSLRITPDELTILDGGDVFETHNLDSIASQKVEEENEVIMHLEICVYIFLKCAK